MDSIALFILVSVGLLGCGFYLGYSRKTAILREDIVAKLVTKRIMDMFFELDSAKVINLDDVNDFYHKKNQELLKKSTNTLE
jgi:hypothetical protein